jgi:RES domain-containing protein
VTPLPPPLGGTELVAWRLDRARYRASWDSGEGAYRVGGRWNGRGVRAVYCSIAPATAILEVAVHTGFPALDTVPHVLTAVTIIEPSRVHVVEPDSAPYPNSQLLNVSLPGPRVRPLAGPRTSLTRQSMVLRHDGCPAQGRA